MLMYIYKEQQKLIEKSFDCSRFKYKKMGVYTNKNDRYMNASINIMFG